MISRDQAADIIDTSWVHSLYWSRPDWEGSAIVDAERELAYAQDRARRLREIIAELKKQEVHDEPCVGG